MSKAAAMHVLNEWRRSAPATLVQLADAFIEGRLPKWPKQFRFEMGLTAERQLREACQYFRKRRVP